MLQDDGGGPADDYDGCGFFKIDGDMTVYFEHSDALVQRTESMGTFASATYYRLGMRWDGDSNYLTPYFDGTAGTPIVCAGSNGAFMAGFGVKAGGNNAETLAVDYHKCLMWPDNGTR
jgi:hypothetical protein